jgi:hypothetical protein
MKDPVYGDSTMTTSASFRTENVTHKPKRMQGANIRANSIVEDDVEQYSNNVPTSLTLEQAIHFYEENAIGVYEQLYMRTAQWLRTILTSREKKKPIPVEEEQPNEENTITAE